MSKTKRRVVIVHGAYGNPNENWFPWLKSQLIELGYEAEVPSFPTPEGQDLDEWLRILDNAVGVYGPETILVGHSLGPSLILTRLQSVERPIRAAFLASAFRGLLGLEDFDKINKPFTTPPLDWNAIRKNCKSFFMYHGSNDPYVPVDKANEIAQALGVKVKTIKDGGHLNKAAGFTSFERLLSDIRGLP